MTEDLERKAKQGEPNVQTNERRAVARAQNQPWPEARREEFRRSEFLSGVDVLEADIEEWGQTFAAFELQRVRYL